MTYKIALRYREVPEIDTVRVTQYEMGMAGIFLYFGDDELSFVPYTNLYNLDIEKED